MTRSVYAPGAGHVWPGTDLRRRKRLLGAPTHPLDANEILWDTLSRHHRH